MILDIQLPEQRLNGVTIGDNTLIFNGTDWAVPEAGNYIVLYSVPVYALSLPFADVESQQLIARSRIRALVLSAEPSTATGTDARVLSEPDPSLGQCLCFITCNGVNLSYVRVFNQ